MLHFHFEFLARDTQISVEMMASGHTEMVDAIRARDADRAEEIAHIHATQFRGRFVQYLDRNITSEMRISLRNGDET